MKRPSLVRFGPAIIAGLLAVAVYLAGGLQAIDYQLADARQGWSTRAASGDIVLVAIDRRSIKQLGAWPWPRSRHGDVVDALREAGAQRIVVDIDLSSPAPDAADDDRLEAALARAGPSRLVLPVFLDTSAQSDDGHHLSTPLARFRQHAQIGHVNVRADRDGRARWFAPFDRWHGTPIPAVAMLLAATPPVAAGRWYVDFAIDPATVPTISYSDAVHGRFDLSAVAGKIVVIGATAPELGDQLSVARWGFIAGPLWHILAAESVRNGNTVRRLSALPTALAVIAFAIAFAELTRRRRWLMISAATLVVLPTSMAASGVSQGLFSTTFDAAPFATAAVLVFLAQLVGALHQQQGLTERRERTARSLLQRNALLRARNEKLFNQAVRDPLTGLPNRLLIGDRIDSTITFAERERREFTVLLMDLDGFKQINDRQGHAAGDAVLVAVAERLSATLRKSDTLGRLGGDEFVAVLPTATTSDAAWVTAQRMVDAVRGIGATGCGVRISVGIAEYPRDGTKRDGLLARADAAMYTAKAAGGNQASWETGCAGRRHPVIAAS